MAESAGRAIFEAIANFSRLRREAQRSKRDLKDLGDEAGTAGRKLGDSEKSADSAGNAFSRLGRALQGPKRALDSLEGSKAHKFFQSLTQHGDRLGGTLTTIRNGILKLAVIGTVATASMGPVLGLVGAVASLSGVIGLAPGLLLAAGAAGAVLGVAFMGVSDVMKAMGGTAEEFEAAIKDLPPGMQEVARTARGLLPALKNIKSEIQAKFWDGLAAPLQKLADKYLPIASYQGGKLAGTFNLMAKELAGFLSKSSTVKDVDGALTNVNKGWRAMVDAVRPLAQVLVDVFAVSSEFLPQMGAGVSKLAQNFADFIRGARESGKLKEWIAGGLEALKQLGQVLMNVGRIIGAVFKAGQDVGGGFLETLRKITDAIADFLESGEGQSALRTLFESIGKAVQVVMPVVKALAKALVGILPILVEMGAHLAPGVIDLINGLGAAIKQAKPFFIALADAVSDLLSAIGSAGPLLGAIVEGLVWATAPLGILADIIRFLASVFAALPQPLQDATGLIIGIGLAALAAAGLIGKLVGAVTGMAATVGKGLSVLGKIPGLGGVGKVGEKMSGGGKAAAGAGVAADALGGAGADADKKGKSAASRFMSALGRGIKAGGAAVAGAVASVFGGMKTIAAGAGTMMGSAFTWAKAGVAAIIRGIGSALTVLGVAFRALGAAMLANPIIAIITAIALVATLIILNWDTVKVWLAAFWEWLQWLFGVIWEFVVTVWTAIAGFFSSVWAGIVAAFTASLNWIQSLWTTVWTAIRDFFVMIWGAITGAAEAAWNWIKSVASTVWNAITGAISTALEAVKNAIGAALGWIKSVWDGAWRGISDAVTSVWNGITSFISGAVGVVKDIIGGVVDFFKWCWQTIKDIVSGIGDAVSKVGSTISSVAGKLNPANWFGKGGLVPGSGTKHYPAMVQPGEYVMPVKETRANLPLLRAMNPHDTGRTLDPNAMVAGMSGPPPAAPALSSYSGPRGGDGASAGGGATVNVYLDVKNPLPEKASVSASKRIGQAAHIGVATAIGGAA